MGLFRLLFRALFAPARPKVRREWRAPEVSGHYTQPSFSPPPLLPPAALVTVLRGRCYVVDGDTILIGDHSIRLAGIDAPELDHPYGKNARSALIRLCKGQVIEAVFDGSNSYQRDVATCYLPDGRDLSAEMVKLGLALDWRRFSGGKYRALETPEARKRLWRVSAKHKGQFPPQQTR